MTGQAFQPTLLDDATAHARRDDPETSHAAAASLTSQRLRQSQREVLLAMRALGPCSDTTLLDRYPGFGLSHQSPSGLRTRRAELVARGLVVDSGKRERLPTGRMAIVWEVLR